MGIKTLVGCHRSIMFSKYYVNVVRRAISRLNLVQNKQTKKDSSLCEIDYTFISKTFIDVYYERLRTPPANNNRLFSRVADQSRFELVATVIAPRPFYKIHHLGNHANKWMNQTKPLTPFLRQRRKWDTIEIIVFTVHLSLHIIFPTKFFI